MNSDVKESANDLTNQMIFEMNERNKEKYNESSINKYDRIIKNRYSWLLVGVVITIVLVSSFVIIFNVIKGQTFTLDVSTILSTLLAFFSIFLSSIFYFKATEQSNAFYDRSYRHTKDIAESLSNMKGEFGKSLDNINTLSMQLNDRMARINTAASSVKSEQQDYMNLYKELMEKAELSEEEKSDFEKALNEKEETINNLIDELNNIGKSYKNVVDDKIWIISNSIVDDFFHNFIDKYLLELRDNPSLNISLRFKDYMFEKGNNIILDALENLGFLDKNIILTNKGLNRIEMIIKRKMNS